MKKYSQILILCIIWISPLSTLSQKKSDIALKTPLDIYLLIGQSNMAGRANLKSEDIHEIPNVYLLNRDNKFEAASNPLNRYSTIRKSLDMQKMGPGYQFAQTLSQNNRDIKIGLVVNARGGSSITEWNPSSKYLNEIIRRAREAQKYGRIKAILWHQGESDQKSAKEYPKQFKKLLKTLRKSLKIKKLPIFIGELGKWRSSSLGINKALYKLAKKSKRVYLIKADSLTHKGDGTHFSRKSQLELGKRYAHKVNEVIYKNTH